MKPTQECVLWTSIIKDWLFDSMRLSENFPSEKTEGKFIHQLPPTPIPLVSVCPIAHEVLYFQVQKLRAEMSPVAILQGMSGKLQDRSQETYGLDAIRLYRIDWHGTGHLISDQNKR